MPLGPHWAGEVPCQNLLELSKGSAKAWEQAQVPGRSGGHPHTAWQGQPGTGDTEVTPRQCRVLVQRGSGVPGLAQHSWRGGDGPAPQPGTGEATLEHWVQLSSPGHEGQGRTMAVTKVTLGKAESTGSKAVCVNSSWERLKETEAECPPWCPGRRQVTRDTCWNKGNLLWT